MMQCLQAGASEVHITLPSHTLWYEALACFPIMPT